MRCPFCGNRLHQSAVLCSECRFDVPPKHLLGIYTSILSTNRDLAKPENLEKLRELAEEEFTVRDELIKKAFEDEKTLRKKESELLVNQRRLASEARLKKNNERRQIASKALIVILAISLLLGTSLYLIDKNKVAGIAKDCLTLQSSKSSSQDSQLKSLANIANLSYVIKSNPNSPNFDFETASQFMDRSLSNLVSERYSSSEIEEFVRLSTNNGMNISKLLKQGKLGQMVSNFKSGGNSLFSLAVSQQSLFDSNLCLDEKMKQDLLINALPSNSKLGLEFSKMFIVKTEESEKRVETSTKKKSSESAAPKNKPKSEPSPTPTFVPASASSYVQKFTMMNIDCKFDVRYPDSEDTFARCYSSDIWVNNHGANKLEVSTRQAVISGQCRFNSPILPVLTRNSAFFRTAEAQFVIEAGKGDKAWLNNAAQIIMDTFGANFCG